MWEWRMLAIFSALGAGCHGDVMRHHPATLSARHSTAPMQHMTPRSSTALLQHRAPNQSYANRVAHSPPKVQHNVTCNECGCMHETSNCNVLLAMSVENRLEALTKRGLCFHCLNPGHRAATCTQRPICARCGRKHATMLHDRKFDSPKKKSNMSAAAIPFRPFAGNTTTPAGEAGTQQESIL